MQLLERVGKLSKVNRVWEGETVLCIAGGPSVTQEIVDAARGKCRTIVVNNSYEIAPWAEVHYFADFHWWTWHKDRPAYQAFPGQRVTIENTGQRLNDPAIHVLRNAGSTGISEKPDAICTGGNSGYQVMNIAFLAGAKKILLLGYDMRFVNKRAHWHADHPTKTAEAAYKTYAARYQRAVPQLDKFGVKVLNCSPGSLIQCFPFSTVAAELAT